MGQAQGEYVTVLGDDDAMHPGALQAIAQALPVDPTASTFFVWPHIGYFHPDWPNRDQRGEAFLYGFDQVDYTGDVRPMSSADTITKVFAFTMPEPVFPGLQGACAPRGAAAHRML